ncbi:hypothetical protein H0Z60_03135 [Ectothiorhodospiraceae bacterium WFHF3C12]|nr:hypothetical protein [Ectothiorhodospiraceae bacterium WFHF3C12]
MAGIALEQGLFGGAVLLFHLVAAGDLGTVNYGVLSALLALFGLVLATAQGLCVEPALALAPLSAKARPAIRRLCEARATLVLFVGITLVIGVGWVIGSEITAAATPWLFWPGLMLFGLMSVNRRFRYLDPAPWRLIVETALFAVLAVAGVMVVLPGVPQPTAATSILGAGAAAGALAILARVLFPRHGGVDISAHVPDIRSRLWRYGGWAALASWAAWVPAGYFILFLGAVGLPDSAAHVRAEFNLVLPALQVGAALAAYLVPRLVALPDDGTRERHFLLITALFTACGAVYSGLLIGFAEPLFEVVYGEDFRPHNVTAVAVGLIPFWVALISAGGCYLKARESVKLITFAYLAGAVVALGPGSVLTWATGEVGGAASMSGTFCIVAVIVAATAIGLAVQRLRNVSPAVASGSGGPIR